MFGKLGDKVAWTELDKDGYESDRYAHKSVYLTKLFKHCFRAKIVIYDLTKDIRYTLTQHFDRSAIELCVSRPSKALKKHIAFLRFIVLS